MLRGPPSLLAAGVHDCDSVWNLNDVGSRGSRPAFQTMGPMRRGLFFRPFQLVRRDILTEGSDAGNRIVRLTFKLYVLRALPRMS